MIQVFKSKEFLSFIVTGGIAATVNFVSRIFYNHWVDYSLAIVLAYITGMIVAFLLAKWFVFQQSQQSLNHSIYYFILVNLLAVIQTFLMTMLLHDLVLPALEIQRYKKEIAHAFGILAPVFTSYLGHKYYSFRA